MPAISCTKENPRWEITRTGTIAYRAKLEYGEGGIRTLEALRLTGFRDLLFRPLTHLSQSFYCLYYIKLVYLDALSFGSK